MGFTISVSVKNVWIGFQDNHFFPTFAPRQVLYGQLPLNPPGQECSKGGWL